MPIEFDHDVIKSFFGTAGELQTTAVSGHRILWIEYLTQFLKYDILLHIDSDAVGISCVITNEFGRDYLYEFCVPCTRVSTYTDSLASDQIGLVFLYEGLDVVLHRRLTIRKSITGELKVCPYNFFSKEHPFNELQS